MINNEEQLTQEEYLFSLDRSWWQKFDNLTTEIDKERFFLTLIRKHQEFLDFLLDQQKVERK